MKSKTLTCVFGLFLASTLGMTSCREDPPPSPAPGTGGAGGTGGTKTGGAGGAKTGGAGGAATGGAGGAKTDGAAVDSGDAAGGTTDTGTSDGAGGSVDTAADMVVVTPDVAIDTVTPQPDLPPAAVVNGCTTFENESVAGANAYIEFKNPLNAAEKCIQVRVGQVVKFGPSPDFQTHPLVPSGGDSPNPIPSHNTGDDDFSVTFPTVGTFGFKCSNHPTMTGAIKVIVAP